MEGVQLRCIFLSGANMQINRHPIGEASVGDFTRCQTSGIHHVLFLVL